MGLLNHICKNNLAMSPKVSKQMGLLALANKLNKSFSKTQTINDCFVSFSCICTEHQLEKCVVLLPTQNFYKSFYSYGFEESNGDTSVSTNDFWIGTLNALEENNKNGWYSLCGDNLNPFFQLFSYEDQNSIQHLHIRKVLDNGLNAIIILAETKQTSVLNLEALNSILHSILNFLDNHRSTI